MNTLIEFDGGGVKYLCDKILVVLLRNGISHLRLAPEIVHIVNFLYDTPSLLIICTRWTGKDYYT